MNTVKDFRNDLLKRREVSAVLNFETNPGFEKVRNFIIEEFKVKEDEIVVNNVLSKYGSDSFSVEFYIYDSVEDKNKIRHKKDVKEKKNGN